MPGAEGERGAARWEPRRAREVVGCSHFAPEAGRAAIERLGAALGVPEESRDIRAETA